jgi:hypothetical protein
MGMTSSQGQIQQEEASHNDSFYTEKINGEMMMMVWKSDERCSTCSMIKKATNQMQSPL